MSRHNFILASTVSILITVASSFSLTGCGSSTPSDTVHTSSEAEGDLTEHEPVSLVEEAATEEAVTQGTRDNTSNVLEPAADGVNVADSEQVTIDVSNADSGYIMVNYKGSNDKPKLQITGPQGYTYNYDLKAGYECFNFTQGSGDYQIGAFEHLGDGKYAQVNSAVAKANISNEFLPYLYPNQYVDFKATDNVVKLGEELAYPANNDLDVVSNVFNYIAENITYDTDLAENVTSDYLPVPDRTLELKTGICFDYAAVMASMLRSQGIPTRMEIGYAGDAYHAWISTYIEDIGWVNGIIEFNGHDWQLMDPTLAASVGSKNLKKFIGDGSNYTICYEY